MILITEFPDGTRVVAEDEIHGVATAHDLIHSLLARAVGLEQSPSLWRVAHYGQDRDDLPTDDLVAYEEAAVLALQEWLKRILPLQSR